MAETPEKEWQALRPSADEGMDAAVQQWAEVDYVPNWTAYSKKDPHYRFLAVREPMHKPPLPGMEVESDRASRFVNMHESDWYKVSGVVTNRTIAREELIRWYRERCGKGEEVHGVLKRDLAAGRLPSGLFGANAAWWSVEKDLIRVDPSDVPVGRDAFLRAQEIIVVRSGAYTADSAIIPTAYERAVTGYDMVMTITGALPKFMAFALLVSYLRDGQLIVASRERLGRFENICTDTRWIRQRSEDGQDSVMGT